MENAAAVSCPPCARDGGHLTPFCFTSRLLSHSHHHTIQQQQVETYDVFSLTRTAWCYTRCIGSVGRRVTVTLSELKSTDSQRHRTAAAIMRLHISTSALLFALLHVSVVELPS